MAKKFSPGDKVVAKRGKLHPNFSKYETTIGTVEKYDFNDLFNPVGDRVLVKWPNEGYPWSILENDLEFSYERYGARDTSLVSKALNLLAKEIRQENDKWWKNPATGENLVRNRPEMMMLMVSEISEAMEGYRKALMDDKLPHRKMETVEFADLFIRLMDYVGEFCPDFGEAVVEKMQYNKTRQDHTNEARLSPGGKKF